MLSTPTRSSRARESSRDAAEMRPRCNTALVIWRGCARGGRRQDGTHPQRASPPPASGEDDLPAMLKALAAAARAGRRHDAKGGSLPHGGGSVDDGGAVASALAAGGLSASRWEGSQEELCLQALVFLSLSPFFGILRHLAVCLCVFLLLFLVRLHVFFHVFGVSRAFRSPQSLDRLKRALARERAAVAAAREEAQMNEANAESALQMLRFAFFLF